MCNFELINCSRISNYIANEYFIVNKKTNVTMDTCEELFSQPDFVENSEKSLTNLLNSSSDSQKTITCDEANSENSKPLGSSIYCPNSPFVSDSVPTDSIMVNVSFTDDEQRFNNIDD